jgi:hypothetical protein
VSAQLLDELTDNNNGSPLGSSGCHFYNGPHMLHIVYPSNFHHMALVRPRTLHGAPRPTRPVQVCPHFAPCCGIHETFCKSISVGILLYNYYLCITTDPGGVPQGWVRHEPTLMTLSAYSRSLRRQNSMTQKATKLRSSLDTQDIVACVEDTNRHAHITARRVKSRFS